MSAPAMMIVKVKFFHIHAMKAYRGSRSTAPLILNLDTRSRRVVSFIPQPLDLGKTPVPTETGRWVGSRVGIDVLEN
jgi:hypothetical protein